MDFTDFEEFDFALLNLGSVIRDLEPKELEEALEDIFITFFDLDNEEISVIPGAEVVDPEFMEEVEFLVDEIWDEVMENETVKEVLEEALDFEEGFLTEEELFEITTELIAAGLQQSEEFDEALDLEPLPPRQSI